MDGNPSCSTETITDYIVDGHIGGKLAAIVDIAGFPERGIRTAYAAAGLFGIVTTAFISGGWDIAIGAGCLVNTVGTSNNWW